MEIFNQGGFGKSPIGTRPPGAWSAKRNRLGLIHIVMAAAAVVRKRQTSYLTPEMKTLWHNVDRRRFLSCYHLIIQGISSPLARLPQTLYPAGTVAEIGAGRPLPCSSHGRCAIE